MAHPHDRLTDVLRTAVAGLVWLTPAVLLALVLEALVGGSWFAYFVLLLTGVGIGVWLEKARAASQPAHPAPTTRADPSSGPPASEDEGDHSSPKYLM